MEVIGSNGEVIKNFKISKFSSYSEIGSKISCEICVDLEVFKSCWELSVFPMYPDGSENHSSINCDIVCELICTFSSAPSASVKNIEILSIIKGRENYPKELRILKDCADPSWKGNLISRVTLESCKLVCKDEFRFSLRFVIPENTIERAEDGAKSMVHRMDYILRNPEYHDVCLVSSSGSKFFVHAAVLQARSNILKTGKVLSSASNVTESIHGDFSEETQISDGRLSFYEESTTHSPQRNMNRDASHSLLCSSTSNQTDCISPFKKKTPLFKVSSCGTSPNNHKKMCSSISSPNKRNADTHTFASKGVRDCFESPKKPTQTHLTSYFPRSSSLKVEVDSSESTISSLPKSPFSYMSPVRQHQLNPSPAKSKRKITTLESPQNKNNFKENGSPSIKNYFISSPINSPCGVLPTNNFQTSKRKLFDDDLDETKNITLIKVNMSTSVTQELLSWIYTGESKRLRELCRPLLVASIRHNVEGLARASQLHLASLLTITNTAEMLLLGHKYKASLLLEDSMQYALLHAGEVTHLQEWAELSLRYPEVVLEFTRRLASRVG